MNSRHYDNEEPEGSVGGSIDEREIYAEASAAIAAQTANEE